MSWFPGRDEQSDVGRFEQLVLRSAIEHGQSVGRRREKHDRVRSKAWLRVFEHARFVDGVECALRHDLADALHVLEDVVRPRHKAQTRPAHRPPNLDDPEVRESWLQRTLASKGGVAGVFAALVPSFARFSEELLDIIDEQRVPPRGCG